MLTRPAADCRRFKNKRDMPAYEAVLLSGECSPRSPGTLIPSYNIAIDEHPPEAPRTPRGSRQAGRAWMRACACNGARTGGQDNDPRISSPPSLKTTGNIIYIKVSIFGKFLPDKMGNVL